MRRRLFGLLYNCLPRSSLGEQVAAGVRGSRLKQVPRGDSGAHTVLGFGSKPKAALARHRTRGPPQVYPPTLPTIQALPPVIPFPAFRTIGAPRAEQKGGRVPRCQPSAIPIHHKPHPRNKTRAAAVWQGGYNRGQSIIVYLMDCNKCYLGGLPLRQKPFG